MYGQAHLAAVRVKIDSKAPVLRADQASRGPVERPQLHALAMPILPILSVVLHGEELAVAAQVGHGRRAEARQRVQLGIVGHAPDAAVAPPVGAGVKGVRLVEIDAVGIRGPGVPRPGQMEVGQGQAGNDGVAQLVELRGG